MSLINKFKPQQPPATPDYSRPNSPPSSPSSNTFFNPSIPNERTPLNSDRRTSLSLDNAESGIAGAELPQVPQSTLSKYTRPTVDQIKRMTRSTTGAISETGQKVTHAVTDAYDEKKEGLKVKVKNGASNAVTAVATGAVIFGATAAVTYSLIWAMSRTHNPSELDNSTVTDQPFDLRTNSAMAVTLGKFAIAGAGYTIARQVVKLSVKKNFEIALDAVVGFISNLPKTLQVTQAHNAQYHINELNEQLAAFKETNPNIEELFPGFQASIDSYQQAIDQFVDEHFLQITTKNDKKKSAPATPHHYETNFTKFLSLCDAFKSVLKIPLIFTNISQLNPDTSQRAIHNKHQANLKKLAEKEGIETEEASTVIEKIRLTGLADQEGIDRRFIHVTVPYKNSKSAFSQELFKGVHEKGILQPGFHQHEMRFKADKLCELLSIVPSKDKDKGKGEDKDKDKAGGKSKNFVYFDKHMGSVLEWLESDNSACPIRVTDFDPAKAEHMKLLSQIQDTAYQYMPFTYPQAPEAEYNKYLRHTAFEIESKAPINDVESLGQTNVMQTIIKAPSQILLTEKFDETLKARIDSLPAAFRLSTDQAQDIKTIVDEHKEQIINKSVEYALSTTMLENITSGLIDHIMVGHSEIENLEDLEETDSVAKAKQAFNKTLPDLIQKQLAIASTLHTGKESKKEKETNLLESDPRLKKFLKHAGEINWDDVRRKHRDMK
jgi:hypothetical protein